MRDDHADIYGLLDTVGLLQVTLCEVVAAHEQAKTLLREVLDSIKGCCGCMLDGCHGCLDATLYSRIRAAIEEVTP